MEISQIKSKEIFEGKFTQKDYSQLEGYLYVPEFEDKEDGKIVKLTAVNK